MSRADLQRLSEIADALEALGVDLEEAEAAIEAAESEGSP